MDLAGAKASSLSTDSRPIISKSIVLRTSGDNLRCVDTPAADCCRPDRRSKCTDGRNVHIRAVGQGYRHDREDVDGFGSQPCEAGGAVWTPIFNLLGDTVLRIVRRKSGPRSATECRTARHTNSGNTFERRLVAPPSAERERRHTKRQHRDRAIVAHRQGNQREKYIGLSAAVAG